METLEEMLCGGVRRILEQAHHLKWYKKVMVNILVHVTGKESGTEGFERGK